MRFFRQVRLVRQQLSSAEGLIGYSLDAHPLTGEYWTLSVWRSQADLDSFVAAEPHRTVMSALTDVMGKTSFCTWTIEAPAGPPSWADAKRRLGANE